MYRGYVEVMFPACLYHSAIRSWCSQRSGLRRPLWQRPGHSGLRQSGTGKRCRPTSQGSLTPTPPRLPRRPARGHHMGEPANQQTTCGMGAYCGGVGRLVSCGRPHREPADRKVELSHDGSSRNVGA